MPQEVELCFLIYLPIKQNVGHVLMGSSPERHLVLQLIAQVYCNTLGNLLDFIVWELGNFDTLLEHWLPVIRERELLLEADEEVHVIVLLREEVKRAGLHQVSITLDRPVLTGKVPLVADLLLLAVMEESRKTRGLTPMILFSAVLRLLGVVETSYTEKGSGVNAQRAL